MQTLPRLKPISMRQNAEEALRRAFFTRRFQPGQSLSEVELATEMGISRGPVREALLLLVQSGLVVHSPNRGFSVIEFTENDLREVNDVRLPLEITALQKARPRISPGDLDQLCRLKTQLVKAYQDGRTIDSSRADMEFHSLIWERSANPKLIAALHNLTASFFAYGAVFSIGRPDLCAGLLEEQHQFFVSYLRGEDHRTAEECVRFHLE
jgi:DNA-binding GntR family transcriptional regulator